VNKTSELPSGALPRAQLLDGSRWYNLWRHLSDEGWVSFEGRYDCGTVHYRNGKTSAHNTFTHFTEIATPAPEPKPEVAGQPIHALPMPPYDFQTNSFTPAMTASAQPEVAAEPVAWRWTNEDINGDQWPWTYFEGAAKAKARKSNGFIVEPLYATSPVVEEAVKADAEWYLDATDPGEGHMSVCDIIDSHGPGKPIEVHHAAVVRVTYHAWLAPANDADSDDNWEATADSEAGCLRAVADELERRARSATP